VLLEAQLFYAQVRGLEEKVKTPLFERFLSDIFSDFDAKIVKNMCVGLKIKLLSQYQNC